MAISRSQGQNGGRVDRGKSLDESLRRRALGLGPLDQMDDPRQCGIATALGDADLERTAAIDGAGEHLVSRSLVDGQRLTSRPAPD